jgi:two-component system osmolarity sensor histidine kinase EnvZ
VSLELPESTRVLAESVGLERILTNVLENARRYAKTPGTSVAQVCIQGTLTDHTLQLDITDHGPGVPADTISQLTQPFFRVDTSRKDASGAGLGLAIVERTLHRMGGRVFISNHPQGGLRVRLELRALH